MANIRRSICSRRSCASHINTVSHSLGTYLLCQARTKSLADKPHHRHRRGRHTCGKGSCPTWLRLSNRGITLIQGLCLPAGRDLRTRIRRSDPTIRLGTRYGSAVDGAAEDSPEISYLTMSRYTRKALSFGEKRVIMLTYKLAKLYKRLLGCAI